MNNLFLCPECRTHCLTLLGGNDMTQKFLCPECRTHCLTLPLFRPVVATVSSDQIAHPEILTRTDTTTGRFHP